MLDQPTESILNAALQLPNQQRKALIDALIDSDPAPESLHSETPPLTNERVRELVDEGRADLAEGRSRSFETPKAMADHVAGIFREARDKKSEA
ncbi:MAG: hypothetical protein AAGB00_06985 [Planctomycetota bacterium]